MNEIIAEVLRKKHCNGCILANSEEHNEVRDETLKIQKPYADRLGRVKILFVAESPPIAFSDDKTSYFYAPGKIKKNTLFYNMISVIFDKETRSIDKVGKEYFLDKFVGSGCYLIDAVKCPINRIGRKEKKNVEEKKKRKASARAAFGAAFRFWFYGTVIVELGN